MSTLKKLREMGVKPKKENLDRLKEQREIKKKIVECLKGGDKTIPEIAKETGLPSPKVTWFLMTMWKYGEVEAVDEVDGYYKYRLTEGS